MEKTGSKAATQNREHSDHTSSHSNQEIKQKIIEVASRLFAEKSFEGASVREIASQCGVNIAMISYYFGGKEGLYLECIANFAKGRVQALQKILTPVQNAEEFKIRLKLFFESMMSLYSEDKHLVRIIIREAQTDRGDEFYNKVMEHLHPIFMIVQNYFESAIQNKIIKADTNAEHLATMTMAVMSHPCIMEKAIVRVQGCEIESDDYQIHYIKQICDTFFSGVLA
jgi:AcrR family transcriptional regulator